MADRDATTDIAIVGCGFGGIALAIALRKAGIEAFTIYERAGDIGGVWRDNRYPGAACDVPSRLYSYSFERGYPWTSQYAPQREIHAYLKHCVEKYGLRPHIRFDTDVRAAAFDEGSGTWTLTTDRDERIEARVFVSAVGLFNRPALPDIPGRETFGGEQFHSARWNHGYTLAGRAVGVIGTGASAIQFVPEIASRVDRLFVFQRTPHYVFPKGETVADGPPRQPGAVARDIERLRVFFGFESGTRRRGSERLTRKGEEAFLGYLARKVADPELRRRLTPDYALGCKRVLRSDDWYDALVRPNVELVDTPIEAMTREGVKTVDGKTRALDAVIYGTGFTPTDYLAPMRVTGLGGRDLNETWREGAEAYLGITVSGFPNMFMLYGPNTNVAGSIIYMLESQVAYIVRCIRKMRRRRLRFMNVRQRAQRAFADAVQRRIGGTVLVHDNCHSYFRTASGRVTTQWPGFMLEYRLRTSNVRWRDYDVVPE